MADIVPASDESISNSTFFKQGLSVTLAGVTLVLGTLLPVLSGPKVQDALVNVVWGSVYGIGFLVTSPLPVTPGIISFVATIFGMLIWPLLVAYGVYKGARALLRSQRPRLLAISAFIFAVSVCWNMPIRQVADSFVYYMPLYTAFMDR